MQYGKVIAYVSRKLHLYEQNQPTYDLELAIVIFALKIWRHYFYGNKCDICLDHENLKYILMQKELNMHQRRWFDLLKDYNLNIPYHLTKANVVVDAFNRKQMETIKAFITNKQELLQDLQKLGMEIIIAINLVQLGSLTVHTTFVDEIKKAQMIDMKLQMIKSDMHKYSSFTLDKNEILKFKNQVCIPNDLEIKKIILEEVHNSRYTCHPRCNEMYKDLKTKLQWIGIKRDIEEYVASYTTSQRIKTKHQRPRGLLKHLEIPLQRQEQITMDFVAGLPCTR